MVSTINCCRIGRQDSSEAQPGLGLGLAIASRIVEMQDSQLTIESDFSRGKVLRFVLPACVRCYGKILVR